jgi:hypothetical protein
VEEVKGGRAGCRGVLASRRQQGQLPTLLQLALAMQGFAVMQAVG